MELEITDTIRAVTEREWEKLAGTNPERSYRWFKTIEESGMRGMHYVLLKESGNLRAAACCYPMKERLHSIEMKFLEVRSPLGTSLTFFSETPQHASLLMKGLREIQKKEDLQGILILDLRKEEFETVKKQVEGFMEFLIGDTTYIDLDFADFNDYLSSLSRKKRKSIRHTVNKGQKRFNLKPVFTNEISKWKKVAYRLQGYLCEEHNDYRRHLTEEFYDALERNLKENAELLLFLKSDIPIFFVLSLNTPEISLYKFLGSDPDYRDCQAYFLMYYEGIRKAIERRQKRIYFGPTTYEFKEKIGCKREELFALAKMENPALNLALKSYSTISSFLGKKF